MEGEIEKLDYYLTRFRLIDVKFMIDRDESLRPYLYKYLQSVKDYDKQVIYLLMANHTKYYELYQMMIYRFDYSVTKLICGMTEEELIEKQDETHLNTELNALVFIKYGTSNQFKILEKLGDKGISVIKDSITRIVKDRPCLVNFYKNAPILIIYKFFIGFLRSFDDPYPLDMNDFLKSGSIIPIAALLMVMSISPMMMNSIRNGYYREILFKLLNNQNIDIVISAIPTEHKDRTWLYLLNNF